MNAATWLSALLLSFVTALDPFDGGGSASPPVAETVAVVGDSYAAGYGADPAHAWEYYAVQDLGWHLQAVRAFPGGGYVNPGLGGPFEPGLMADPLPASVDEVIVQGGFNDAAYGPSEVGDSVARTLAVVHAQAPGATVTVIGALDPGSGTYDAELPGLRGNAPTVEQVVTAAGDRYVDGFQFAYEVAADGAHPSPAGHEQLGRAIARAIANRSGVPARGGR